MAIEMLAGSLGQAAGKMAGILPNLIGGVGSMIGNRRANKELEKLLHSNPVYNKNPIAAERLALAQSLLNARAPGAASIERNIFSNQAGAFDQVNRNATTGAQALAMTSAITGQTNQALNQLGVQEQQDYYNRLGVLGDAQELAISEDDKVYQDRVRRFQDTVAIRGAQNANRQNNWKTVGNLGAGLYDVGSSIGSANKLK